MDARRQALLVGRATESLEQTCMAEGPAGQTAVLRGRPPLRIPARTKPSVGRTQALTQSAPAPRRTERPRLHATQRAGRALVGMPAGLGKVRVVTHRPYRPGRTRW